MKHIGNLSPAPGSRHKKKRIGRGAGSGHGGTSTRGHKGHQSRSGFSQSPGFEGGQMSLKRRVPKFGFTNINRIEYQEVNVATLQRLVDEKLVTNGSVTNDVLLELGVIRKRSAPVKILGNGDLSAKLSVTCDKISETAKQKIEAAGGAVTVNG
ncbi:MAG: 50S ribosomal protein L15 [Ignavibacteria bacterium]|mgnify:CR=1 FL=1|jgi:large subunit ribosomal protein L15|nr:50S ribosomal protein L15 [Ignavibacteria bacterium]MBP6509051.1 50S ribosomal protein L15 [Candidatus Kapabacteria bacterium]MBK6419384.1 50S ribosomal protein L15 [Ignavibacteria bacterium]MBK6759985.1 50S ribosomal protein L15 [Ignavibacteria bacterium]MBK7032818.1 50S ribosomal protein L15 [Ignavibacteria bacterium]